MPSRSSAAYRAMKYQELLQEFLYIHDGVLTPAEIAQKNEIEKHFVDFKLNILAAKGYQLPVLPELHNDFLKDTIKNCSESEQKIMTDKCPTVCIRYCGSLCSGAILFPLQTIY